MALQMSFDTASAVGSHLQYTVMEEILIRLLSLLTGYSDLSSQKENKLQGFLFDKYRTLII